MGIITRTIGKKGKKLQKPPGLQIKGKSWQGLDPNFDNVQIIENWELLNDEVFIFDKYEDVFLKDLIINASNSNTSTTQRYQLILTVKTYPSGSASPVTIYDSGNVSTSINEFNISINKSLKSFITGSDLNRAQALSLSGSAGGFPIYSGSLDIITI